MSNRQQPSEMLYNVEEKMPLASTLLAAFQHLMAVFVGICTPAMIIGGSFKLPLEMTAHLVSISLISSAFGTFLQVNRFGGIGSGLLSVVGTSFIFPATISAIGMGVINSGGTQEEAIATISGIALLGSLVQVGISFLAPILKRVFTPLVNGVIVTLIGISLCRVGMIDLCGGYAAMADGSFASLQNIVLGMIVLGIIIVVNCMKSFVVRASAILIGLLVGYLVAILLGRVDFSPIEQMAVFTAPVPFKYGLSFSFNGFLVMCLGYMLSCAEATGDVAACCSITGLPATGPDFNKRIRGAIFVDGISSSFAAILNGFPVSTFSQNNGIIQVTGIASRHVGKFVALLLLMLGLFPIVGGLFAIIPRPVLGGATLLLFGTVAAAGYRIISEQKLDRRSVLILAMALGTGMGVEFVPEFKTNLHPILQEFCHSAVSAGGFVAILGNLLIPHTAAVTVNNPEPKIDVFSPDLPRVESQERK